MAKTTDFKGKRAGATSSQGTRKLRPGRPAQHAARFVVVGPRGVSCLVRKSGKFARSPALFFRVAPCELSPRHRPPLGATIRVF